METKKYIVLNKPKQVLSSTIDERGRRTVIDLLDQKDRSVRIAGRLDYGSCGLMILTDDGQLITAITSPKNCIQKEYLVTIKEKIAESDLERVKKGAVIDGMKVSFSSIRMDQRTDAQNTIRVILTEGKKRELRRVLEFFGYHVINLKRIRIGNVKISILREGEYRYMTEIEIKGLKSLAGSDV